MKKILKIVRWWICLIALCCIGLLLIVPYVFIGYVWGDAAIEKIEKVIERPMDYLNDILDRKF